MESEGTRRRSRTSTDGWPGSKAGWSATASATAALPPRQENDCPEAAPDRPSPPGTPRELPRMSLSAHAALVTQEASPANGSASEAPETAKVVVAGEQRLGALSHADRGDPGVMRSRFDGDEVHASNWPQTRSTGVTASFDAPVGHDTEELAAARPGIAQASSTSASRRMTPRTRSCARDSRRWAYARMFVSTAITAFSGRRRWCPAGPATSTAPGGRARPRPRRSSPATDTGNGPPA